MHEDIVDLLRYRLLGNDADEAINEIQRLRAEVKKWKTIAEQMSDCYFSDFMRSYMDVQDQQKTI